MSKRVWPSPKRLLMEDIDWPWKIVNGHGEEKDSLWNKKIGHGEPLLAMVKKNIGHGITRLAMRNSYCLWLRKILAMAKIY